MHLNLCFLYREEGDASSLEKAGMRASSCPGVHPPPGASPELKSQVHTEEVRPLELV